MATKVTIQGVEYDYRFDLGALLCYERLTGKLQEEMESATPTKLSLVMHYSCLACDEKFTMSLAGFVNSIDSAAVLAQLNDAFQKEQNRWNGLNTELGNEEKGTRGKKK